MTDTTKLILVLMASPPPVTALEEKTAREKLNSVGLWLAYEHPHFGLAWSRCKARLTITRMLGTMGVFQNGAMLANPDFVAALSTKQLGFVLCHEVLHVAGEHFTRSVSIGVCNDRGEVGDPAKREAWGLATDMAINRALMTDRVGEMPTGDNAGVLPPPDYSGNYDAESIYVWLMKKAKQQSGKPNPSADDVRKAAGMKSQGAGAGHAVLQGCLPGQGEGEKEAKEKGRGSGAEGAGQQSVEIPLGDTIRAALSAGIGTGSAVAELLSPKPPRCRWETVLQSGFTTASLEATNRIYPTYARTGRRESLLPGGIVRGRKGGHPSVALVIDVSGSMDREAVAQIIGEAMAISKLISASLFLAVHTEKLEWSGWVKQGDVETLRKACARTGGTDAGPAYEAVASESRKHPFDCLVHFTDTFLPYWPAVPAKRLVVGATGLPNGAALGCQPPPGAKVLRVEV